ncbi:MAG: ABC transporter transmembrane domain-containing protein [Steroidobacteraceae bacterium]
MSSGGESRLIDHLRWLWPFLRPRLAGLLAVLLLASLISALATAQPYLSKLIIDEGLIGRRFDRLALLCAAIVGLALAGALLGGLNRALYLKLSGRILFDLRESIYAHLLTLAPAFFRARPVGDLVARLDGDVSEVQRFSTDSVLAVINALLMLIATAAIMLRLSPLLCVVALGAVPLQLLLRHLSRRRLSRTTHAVREQSGRITQFLVETLGSAKGVQGAVAEEFEQQRLARLNEGFLSRILSQQLLSYGVGAGSTVLSHLTTAAVFLVGGWQVIQNRLTVGTLVAFTAYFSRGSGSALSLMNLYLAWQRAAVSLVRVRELLDAGSTLGAGGGSASPARDGHAAIPGAPTIRFEAVRFTPEGASAPLFQDLDWEIRGGAKTVLSGASGAGKSSLIDLLRGFAQVQAGAVRLDGRPLAEFSLKALRRSIVVLETEPLLFRGSLLHNLRYGHFDAPDEAVLAAARRAGVDRFATGLPGGYSTELGAGGAGLSTGQRQRIAIARALLARPAVLVLDEATSNLDAPAVAELHALIDEHFAEVTRLVITHAPSLVPRVDAWYELHEGAMRRGDAMLDTQ